MPRLAARQKRLIKISRMEGRIRDQVGAVWAFNLPEAIQLWYDVAHEAEGYHAPHFQANTVTLLTADDAEEVYVASD